MPELPSPDAFRRRPSQEVLDELEAHVRALGGHAVEGRRHVGQEISYADRPHPQREALTCGCGNETVMEVPYETKGGAQGLVNACAVCDLVAEWPRIGMR